MAQPEPPGGQQVTLDRALEPSLERLAEIARLAPDWDSYGAAPPSALAIARSAAFLVKLHTSFIENVGKYIGPSHVAPLADGGIQLEWSGPSAEIEVQIGPEGTFGYLLINKQGANRTHEEADEVPELQIIQLILNIVRQN
jgi:hypothetical protein